ncbi:MAG: DNA polymerase III subunit delta, partial [Bacilli bacterium]
KTDFKEDKFLKYINNPSDNILILVVNKLNNRLKIVTEIKKVFKIITIKNIDYNTFIENNLENYKMDKSTIQYFLNKVGQNYNIIESELEKLKLYKVDKKIITKEDIDLVSNRNIESSIFDLIDSIVKKDKKKVYELYEHFLSSGTEIIQIMIMLANQIRLIYNVKVLNRLSDSEISNLLEVHEYPVKLARNKGYNYSKKELLNMLYNLAILDEDIKSNKCLQNISFLTFIMQI